MTKKGPWRLFRRSQQEPHHTLPNHTTKGLCVSYTAPPGSEPRGPRRLHQTHTTRVNSSHSRRITSSAIGRLRTTGATLPPSGTGSWDLWRPSPEPAPHARPYTRCCPAAPAACPPGTQWGRPACVCVCMQCVCVVRGCGYVCICVYVLCVLYVHA